MMVYHFNRGKDMSVKDLFETSLLIEQLQDELATIDERLESGEITDAGAEEKRIANEYATTAEHLEELVDSITYSIKKRQAEIDLMQDTIRQAQKRKASAEKALGRFKDLMLQYMNMQGVKKIKGTAYPMFIMTTQHVKYTGDPKDLPPECQRITIEPDKKALKERLAAGDFIPGAVIEHGSTLVVR
jgi:hypothetical protein